MNSLKTSTRTKFGTLGMASLMLLCFAVTAQAGTVPTTDLLIQLDGSNTTTTGALVDSWNDQSASGGSQDFTQSGATRPTLLSGVALPNGTIHNVVDFDDGPNNLILGADSSMDNLATQSWYMVVRFDDPGTQTAQTAYGVSYSSIATKIGTEITTGNAGHVLRKASNAQDVNTGGTAYGPSNGEWLLISGRWNMTNASVSGLNGETSTFAVYDSTGTQQSSGSRAGVDGLPGTHNRTVLGGRGDLHGARDMDGAIAELLVYNDILSDVEQGAVETYLLDKYFNTTIPEPGSMALLALGSCCLGIVRRRRS